jgi:hypothetical protein
MTRRTRIRYREVVSCLPPFALCSSTRPRPATFASAKLGRPCPWPVRPSSGPMPLRGEVPTAWRTRGLCSGARCSSRAGRVGSATWPSRSSYGAGACRRIAEGPFALIVCAFMVTVNSGLCELCRHCKFTKSKRGSVFYMCLLHELDSRFAKYPRLPVMSCSGYAKKTEDKSP